MNKPFVLKQRTVFSRRGTYKAWGLEESLALFISVFAFALPIAIGALLGAF